MSERVYLAALFLLATVGWLCAIRFLDVSHRAWQKGYDDGLADGIDLPSIVDEVRSRAR
jgi:hypothetical protein